MTSGRHDPTPYPLKINGHGDVRLSEVSSAAGP